MPIWASGEKITSGPSLKATIQKGREMLESYLETVSAFKCTAEIVYPTFLPAYEPVTT